MTDVLDVGIAVGSSFLHTIGHIEGLLGVLNCGTC